jgi:hypothetical protein
MAAPVRNILYSTSYMQPIQLLPVSTTQSLFTIFNCSFVNYRVGIYSRYLVNVQPHNPKWHYIDAWKHQSGIRFLRSFLMPHNHNYAKDISNKSSATNVPLSTQWNWHFVKKTNLMHCLSLIYFVLQPLYVSGVFIAHYQEVFTV